MEKITGFVQEKTERKTAKGDSVYDLTINNVKMSTFRPGDIAQGDYVEADYLLNGSFKNIHAIKKISPPPGQTVLPVIKEPQKEPSRQSPVGERLALQAYCLAAATALNGTPEAHNPVKVFEYAVALRNKEKEIIGD